jgi:hypothetical protein
MPDPTGTGAEERRWTITGYSCRPFAAGEIEVVPASDLAALQERLEEMTGDTRRNMFERLEEITAERDSLALEVERLKEALGFYADERNYAKWSAKKVLGWVDQRSAVHLDIGGRARAALRDGDPEAGSESSNQQSVEGR